MEVKTTKYYWQVSDSYTNPNATCPTCRAKVFYYESPFGGKVYFDYMGPPWPQHPCMDRHHSTNRMKFLTEQVQSTNKLTAPNYQVEDGWRPVYCAEIKNSTELSGCIVLLLYEPENRKLLYAKHKRETIDERSPILIRRIKDTKHYEISTLSLRDESPSELRFLAFTSVAELKRFDIEAQVADDRTETKNTINSSYGRKDGHALATNKKVRYDPNRPVKISMREQGIQLADKGAEKDKNRLGKNLLDQQNLPNTRAKRREEILEKRRRRKMNREIRENDEKNNAKQLTKTALEQAFEKASIGRRKDN
jgi:hypothetical protein